MQIHREFLDNSRFRCRVVSDATFVRPREPSPEATGTREMAHRLPLLYPLVIALLSLPCTHARADIGFAQAAAIARASNPNRPLVNLRVRGSGADRRYQATCVNQQLTVLFGMDIDAETGAIDGIENDPVLPDEEPSLRAILERLAFCQVDFAQAVALASVSAGDSAPTITRCDLSSDLFMLTYDLRYDDGLRLEVDAISGQVVPHTEDATPGNALSTAAYEAAVDEAMAIAAAYGGAQWRLFSCETAETPDGIAMGFMFLDPLFGQVLQVDMLGKVTQVVDFPPVGTLFENVQAIRARLPQIVVTAPQFLARIEPSFPGCRISAIDLQVQDNNGTVRTRWSASILTALNQQLEFSIDATVPAQLALGVAAVPQPRRIGDLDRDGHVGSDDLVELVSTLDSHYPPNDLDQDGWVTMRDLAILLGNWG